MCEIWWQYTPRLEPISLQIAKNCIAHHPDVRSTTSRPYTLDNPRIIYSGGLVMASPDYAEKRKIE